jgi:hypothetical protein
MLRTGAAFDKGHLKLNSRSRKILTVLAVIAGVFTIGGLLFQWLVWQLYLASMRPGFDFDATRVPAAPDYNNASSWVVTPDEVRLSTVTPDSLPALPAAETEADVFFVHPTSYFGRENWNADIGDLAANTFLETLVVPGQMTVFNACCRIYAPRYRQATLYVFMEADDSGRQALEIAYDDVRRAFSYYLVEHNEGRPFILASHSQGTLHAIRLLEEEIANNDVRERLIAAYLPGFALPEDKWRKAGTVPICQTAKDATCVVAWDTYGKTGGPKHATDQSEHYYANAKGGHWERRSGKKAICVNPMSWSTDGAIAARALHKGATYVELPGIRNTSTQPALAPLARRDISARCGEDGYLYISEPSSPVYRIGKLPGENYHAHDYSLFYGNIRDNAVDRVNAYLNLE